MFQELDRNVCSQSLHPVELYKGAKTEEIGKKPSALGPVGIAHAPYHVTGCCRVNVNRIFRNVIPDMPIHKLTCIQL